MIEKTGLPEQACAAGLPAASALGLAPPPTPAVSPQPQLRGVCTDGSTPRATRTLAENVHVRVGGFAAFSDDPVTAALAQHVMWPGRPARVAGDFVVALGVA